MKIPDNLTTSVVDPKTTKRKYPEARIIVLDDNFNTFEHVANCLVRFFPGISEKNHGYLHSKFIGKVWQKYGEDPLSRQNYFISNLSSKD
jgi:ATP-dependent Clp protease adaptor protein ClpS